MTTKNVIDEYGRITGKIKDTILHHVKDVLAIIYIGSWARIEMSYTIENGNIKFLNDIDVLLITKDKVGNIKFLRDEASKAINEDYFSYEDYIESEGVHNFYVDVRNYRVEDLKNISPRIKYYDIFYDPKIIYVKNKDIIKLLPKIDIDKIFLQDGLIHLFNRMALLIEWNPFIVKKDKHLSILILKAYSAILDALLLINRKYVTSLQEKAYIFNACYEKDFYELWKKFPGLIDRINIAVDMKINYYKHHEKIDDEIILNIWNNARTDIIITTIYVINIIYGTMFELSLDHKNIRKITEFLENKNGFAISSIIKEYSKKKFGFGPGPFIGFIYLLIRYKYFSKFNGIGDGVSKENKNIIIKTISSVKEPTSQLYLAALSLLSGMNYTSDKATYNGNLVYMANNYLDNISLEKDISINISSGELVNKFRKIFRIWELFTFDQ